MTENIKIQSDISDVLLKLKTIVRDKTRFEADDVNQVSASEVMQSFVVSVEHRLVVTQDSELITGLSLSKDTSETQSSKNPYQDSVVAGEDLLEIASIQIQSTVVNPETKYNFVRGGVFLNIQKNTIS